MLSRLFALFSRAPGSAGARRAARRRSARGQAVVEFAIFIPLLMFMLTGATDIASLLNDHLNVVYAARTSARVGATLGAAPQADCAIIGSLRAALAADHNLQVNQIIIFRADANGNPIAANEDVYSGSAVCNANGTISPPALVSNWTPGARSTIPFTEDSLGVEVDFTYTFQLNVLGMGQFTSFDRAVMPMEVVLGAPIPPSGVGQ